MIDQLLTWFGLDWLDLLAPSLAFLAFLLFARGMVARQHGKTFLVLPELAFILFELSFRFLFDQGNLYQCLYRMLVDNGIGLILASVYLSMYDHHPKILWVPGVLAIMLASLLFWGKLFLVKSVGFLNQLSKYEINLPKPNALEDDGEADILLELGADDQIEEIEAMLKKEGYRWKKAFPVSVKEDADAGNAYWLYRDGKPDKSWLAALKGDTENVDEAEINDEVYAIPTLPPGEIPAQAAGYTNDPEFGKQWYWQLYGEELFAKIKTLRPKRKAKVAIIDTGIDGKHEDLQKIVGKTGYTDQQGHGTHCAGIAAAVANNQTGIASLNWEGKWLQLYSYPALGDRGTGTDKQVAEAIFEAATANVDVISLSLGSYSPIPSRSQEIAIQYALKRGIIVVVAAGNDDENANEYSPANIPGVIVVSALAPNLEKASFSNFNTSLKFPIAAPGVDIFSLQANGTYVAKSGTSMATPMVAGVAGVLKALNPKLRNQEVWRILHETGTLVPSIEQTGRMINPLPAIEAVSGRRGAQ